MRASRFSYFASFLAMLATPALGADNLGTVLCQKDSISISPDGTYAYVYEIGQEVILTQIDCLMQHQLEECPTRRIQASPANYVRNYFFSNNDRYLYYLEALPDAGGAASGQGVIERIDVKPYLSGQPSKTFLDQKLATKDDILAYIDIFPNAIPEGGYRNFMMGVNKVFAKAQTYYQPLPVNPSRNIYGAVFPSGYFFLRVDGEYNIYGFSARKENALISKDGLSYFKPRSSTASALEYPIIRSDGQGIFIAASGSILHVDENLHTTNLTLSEARVKSVDGDNQGKYYGYFSDTHIHLVNADPSLKVAIEHAAASIAGTPITGVSINNRTRKYILSAKPEINLTESGPPTQFLHSIYSNGKRKPLNCQYRTNYTFKQKHIGGNDGIWISSFIQNPAFKTVVYIYGGPNSHVSVQDMKQFSYLFSAGYNVDLVNYGGSDYTYDLANRLNRLGYKSFARDASNLEAYVKGAYKPGQAHLIMASFGGQFYRYLSKEGLEHFGKVVMIAPSGANKDILEPADNPSVVRMRKILGEEIFSNHLSNSYFENLKTCPLKTKTLIVAGSKDSRVFPIQDYGLCQNSDELILFIDDLDHGAKLNEVDKVKRRSTTITNYLQGTY